MIDRRAKNRLRPPLMFAFREAFEAKDARKKLDLRDESGERVVAGRRAAPRAAITEAKLRREVTIDLESLVNTINLGSSIDLKLAPFVEKSVLNYGFPDIGRHTIDESMEDIRSDIETVLNHYEPRLVKETIVVTRDETVDKMELKIRFLVRADLTCEPVNVPVEFVADLELDSGKIVIQRR